MRMASQIYPRKWNSSFLDLPIVENQNQQSVTAQEIESAIAKATEAEGVLMLLLAASGLRIGESLAIRTERSEHASFFADGAVTTRTMESWLLTLIKT
jgi:hypothetical protein